MSDNKDTQNNPDDGGDKGKEGEAYLGSWATREDAEAGLKNLQTKLSEQGNETGLLRKQFEDSQTMIGQMQSELEASKEAGQKKASDLETEGIRGEQAKIEKQIENLDPVDEDYSKELTGLIKKSNALAAKAQSKQTLASATEAFRTELDERDIKTAHRMFRDANPDFDTPEMQAQIKQYIANDPTGMSDALVAYREIQRDSLTSQMKDLATQNEELMKRLNLKKGTDETGTVIVKSQGTQETKPKTKTVGAERNMGMQAVLEKMRIG